MTSPTRFRELRKKAARVTGAHHAFSPRKRPAPDLEREASVPGTSPDFLSEEPEGETKMDPDFDAEEASQETTDREAEEAAEKALKDEMEAVWVLGYRVDTLYRFD